MKTPPATDLTKGGAAAERVDVTFRKVLTVPKDVILKQEAEESRHREKTRAGEEATRITKPTCKECERLWKDYQRATVEHIRAEGKVHTSIKDIEDFKRAAKNAEEALGYRQLTRAALLVHRLETGHE